MTDLDYKTLYPNIVKNTNCSNTATQGIQVLMPQIFFSCYTQINLLLLRLKRYFLLIFLSSPTQVHFQPTLLVKRIFKVKEAKETVFIADCDRKSCIYRHIEVRKALSQNGVTSHMVGSRTSPEREAFLSYCFASLWQGPEQNQVQQVSSLLVDRRS